MTSFSEIYEGVRQQIISLESLRTEACKLKTTNKVVRKLKLRIDNELKTAIADLLNLSTLLYDAESCYTENDLETLLELFQRGEQQWMDG